MSLIASSEWIGHILLSSLTLQVEVDYYLSAASKFYVAQRNKKQNDIAKNSRRELEKDRKLIGSMLFKKDSKVDISKALTLTSSSSGNTKKARITNIP